MEAGVESVVLRETRGPHDARRWAHEAANAGAEVIVVAGGDGTVREVAIGAADSGTPVLIAPCGTENVVAKHLGIVLDADGLMDILQTGRTTPIDIASCGERSYLFVAGIGFDAEVIRRLAEIRRGHISYITYLRPILGSMLAYRSPRLRLDIDGAPVFEGRGLLLIANLPRYAMGMRVVPDALASDGRLDVCMIEYRNLLGFSWQALKVLAGVHVGSFGMKHWRATRVRVDAEGGVPVELDGDVAGTTPIEISITGRQARFLVSQTSEWPT